MTMILRAFFSRHVQRESPELLTAETFARMAGELESAYRLASVKRRTSASTAGEGDRPPPRERHSADRPSPARTRPPR